MREGALPTRRRWRGFFLQVFVSQHPELVCSPSFRFFFRPGVNFLFFSKSGWINSCHLSCFFFCPPVVFLSLAVASPSSSILLLHAFFSFRRCHPVEVTSWDDFSCTPDNTKITFLSVFTPFSIPPLADQPRSRPRFLSSQGLPPPRPYFTIRRRVLEGRVLLPAVFPGCAFRQSAVAISQLGAGRGAGLHTWSEAFSTPLFLAVAAIRTSGPRFFVTLDNVYPPREGGTLRFEHSWS